MADPVSKRAAQLRPCLEQHSDGLADQDRAGPVTVPQIMQPRSHFGRHDQGIAHAGASSRSRYYIDMIYAAGAYWRAIAADLDPDAELIADRR
jgi:hypothetical protein